MVIIDPALAWFATIGVLLILGWVVWSAWREQH